MTNPLVSIVVCCHNRRAYLEQTMQAIFDQRYQPVEIVVLDDGSTDGTDALMASFGDRVRYHWQEQRGIAATRTAACKLARGEYIAFQDDDDIMPPDRIVHSYEALKRHPEAVFATGDYAIIDPQGRPTGVRNLPGGLEETDEPRLVEDAYTAVLWPTIPVSPHTALFRTRDGERVEWFDHEFRYSASDKDFFARLARLGPVVYLREIVSYYRRGHPSIWSDDFRARFGDLQLWSKHLRMMDETRGELRDRLQARLLDALRRVASYRSRGMEMNDPLLARWYHIARDTLGLKQRLSYELYRTIKLPIRNLVRG